VRLPTFVIETLKRHRKSQNERRLLVGESWHDHDLVIDCGNGEPLPPHTLSQQFRVASRKAGLDLNFHGLRHAHASLMLAGGVHLKVVSDHLGHSTISITADLYSHVAPGIEDQAAATLDDLIRHSPSRTANLPAQEPGKQEGR
jgi:integrase